MTPTDLLILEIVVFVAVPIAVGMLVNRRASEAAKRRHWSPLAVRTLETILTVGEVAAVIVGLGISLGSYSFLSALTVSAIGAIAVTLALQTTLQNILSGFVLVHQRYLRLGDVVQFSGIKGTIVSIGLVEIVIKTDTGALAMVSASNLLSGPLVNFTAPARLAGEY